jgi:FlaG/FlaF family flagellin (archaellin)
MKRVLKSKGGISPILATLLLIVIAVAAVIVTYAWVMSFTTSTTSKAGAVLSLENVGFYNSSGVLKVDITIRNSGTSDAKIVDVFNGTSSTNLAMTTAAVTYNPTTQKAVAGGSLTITLSPFTWTTGTTYYFKFVTDSGITLPFNQAA